MANRERLVDIKALIGFMQNKLFHSCGDTIPLSRYEYMDLIELAEFVAMEGYQSFTIID